MLRKFRGVLNVELDANHLPLFMVSARISLGRVGAQNTTRKRLNIIRYEKQKAIKALQKGRTILRPCGSVVSPYEQEARATNGGEEASKLFSSSPIVYTFSMCFASSTAGVMDRAP